MWNSGYIYCITSPTYQKDSIYKIGLTNNHKSCNLISRYKTYTGGETPKLFLFEQVGNSKEAEKALKSLLSDYHTNGEWYQVDYNIIDYCFSHVKYHYPTPDTYMKYLFSKYPESHGEIISNMNKVRQQQIRINEEAQCKNSKNFLMQF